MKSSSKIIIVLAVIVAVVVIVTAYTFLNSALAPLEQREDKATAAATQNVTVNAVTFNGDIVIEASTSDQIELTYNIEAPKGHISEITTTTTNQTLNGNTEIVTEAKLVNSSNLLKANYRASLTLKLPSTSQYNLTLNTSNGNIIKSQLNDRVLTATTENGYIDIKDDNATSIQASSQNGNVKVSLVEGTLFQVDANTENGHVTYQGIAMTTSIQTSAHLKGNTTAGSGSLNLNLSSENGNVTIEYFAK